MGILETTCLEKQQFDSLPFKILNYFFNVMCKKIVWEINSNMHTSKEEKIRMVKQTQISINKKMTAWTDFIAVVC